MAFFCAGSSSSGSGSSKQKEKPGLSRFEIEIMLACTGEEEAMPQGLIVVWTSLACTGEEEAMPQGLIVVGLP